MCHEGRVIREPIVREMLRALGVECCPRCHRVIRVHGRRGRIFEYGGSHVAQR